LPFGGIPRSSSQASWKQKYRKEEKNCTGIYIGLARTIYIRCTYGIFGREIIKYTVIYGVYIRFWPTLHIQYV